MTEAQSRFITEDDYIRYRGKQDTDIYNELVNQHNLIGRVKDDIQVLKDEVGQVKDEVGQVKDEVRQVKDEVRQVKDEVGQVKNEVGQVKDRLCQVDGAVGEIKAQLDQMKARSYNNLRFLPSHNIDSIGIYQPGIGFRKPTYFPPRVEDFWNLQLPKNEEHLIYLVRFYDIQGYEHWRAENFDFNDNQAGDSEGWSSGESDSSQPHLSLEDAIRSYPYRAVEELATCVGIGLQKICDFYARLAEYQRQPQQRPTKRPPADVYTAKGKEQKRPRKSDTQFSPQPDIPMLPSRSTQPTKPASTNSPQTKIGWDVHSTERRREDVLGKLEEAGSSTEEMTSQEVASN